MRFASSLRLRAFSVAAFGLAAAAGAQTAPVVSTSARPSVRVTGKIDNAVTVQLPGTHPAVVEHATVGARLPASRQLSHMMLVLSPSDDQEYAMRTLLDQQQDKTSANYHKWLTPDTYAQTFGIASADVARVTAWLQDQGFTVNGISRSTRIVTFSGTVGQVETAFHTQMNSLSVNGEAHISNTSDIAIPQALSSVIRGVASLNDFFPRSNAVGAHKAAVVTDIPAGNYITPEAQPLYTSTSSGAHYVTPGDAAIIFNSTPLLNAGIDGTGQTIAVLGRTNITLSDVQQFRSMFGLKKNDPTFTVIGEDPGINTDDIEAYLDVEWAGGMAPGASVNFIVGGTDYETTGGISNAGLYAVDNNIADIITLSYGGCETSNGASGTAFWNTLWEQAAAQGQTAFISSGDSNATGCQSSSATYGTAYGVNALGSSAYNVAVGGSMFVDWGPSQYWTAGAVAPVPAGYTFTTATSYIPEAVWNQGALTTTYLNTSSTALQTGSGIVGGGGGLSIYTARPSWQTGSGISSTADATCSSTINGTCYAANGSVTGLHRMVPDISFIAASGHDASAFCAEGSCNNTSTGYGIGAVGGTSVATPVMASVQALINQKNGGRQGNVNFYYYPLANVDYVAGNCKAVNGTASNPTVTLPGAGCNFHDIVAGSNISKQNSTDTVGIGFSAGTGYDAASGLGSVNINNVATDWSTVNFNATTTVFSLTPTTVATHGAAQSFSVTVSSTAGTPTGDVSIIAATTSPGTKFSYTLSSGAYSGTLAGLPAGTYNVHAHYEGDGNFAPSDSANIQVTVGMESSTVALSLYSMSSTGSTTANATSIPYGYLVDLIGTVAGASSTGIPTGTVTYAISLNGTALASYTGKLDATGSTALIAGASYTTRYLGANYPSLTAGSYTVTASYSGDSTFSASSNSTSFTVTQQTPSATLTASSAYIVPGASLTLNYTLARLSSTSFATLAAYPSGTVNFTNLSTGASLGTVTVNSVGVASLSTSALTTAGNISIQAAYSGDTNYASTSATTAITVGASTTTTTTLAVTAGTYYVLSSVPLTATVTPAVSGTVFFYDGGVLLGSGALTAGASSSTATLSASTLIAGSHTLTATFAGSSTYTGSSGSTTLTVNQNVTTTYLDAPAYSTAGQTISMNGRVGRSPTQSSAGTVLLTGTVTFYDGATAIASATPVYLPGGYYYYMATASTSALARGTHTITAAYSGDVNFASSTSSSVKLTVVPDNVWIANSGGTVTAVTTSGTSVANSAGGGTGIAIDNSGNIWSLNESANSLAEFTSTGSVVSSGYTGAGLSTPTSLAIDGSGMVWIANSNSTVSEVSSTGTAVSPSTGYTTTTATPSSISIDASGNLWITNSGDNSVTEVVGAAAPVMTPTANAVSTNSLAAKP